MDRPTYAAEECLLLHRSVEERIRALESQVRDHAQRFDTLQTPLWRRVRFWLHGWPWCDLNGTRVARPWHRIGLWRPDR